MIDGEIFGAEGAIWQVQLVNDALAPRHINSMRSF